jgi:chorismate synthase
MFDFKEFWNDTLPELLKLGVIGALGFLIKYLISIPKMEAEQDKRIEALEVRATDNEEEMFCVEKNIEELKKDITHIKTFQSKIGADIEWIKKGQDEMKLILNAIIKK